MAYSKPERKKHQKKKLKLTRLDKADPKSYEERARGSRRSQIERDLNEHSRTIRHLSRKGLKINPANKKRYHRSREM
tara:strand:+ start:1027 stop:1257 length:231 start_codon:yes stop_codon:yes gene_type:complete